MKKFLLAAFAALIGIFVYSNILEIKSQIIRGFVGDTIASFRDHVSLGESHVITTIRDEKLPIVVSSHDGCVSKFIRMKGVWEPHVSEAVLKVVKPGNVVVEVGANYGYYTLKMAHRVGPTGKILSYEANPDVFRALRKSIVVNDFESRVILSKKAVSDKAHEAFLVYNMGNVGGGYIVNDPAKDFKKKCSSDPMCHSVDVTTLNEALSGVENVHVLRMDAEGSEILILQGAERLLESSPDLTVVMEWDQSMMKRYGSIDSLINLLKRHNFTHIWDINHKRHLSLKELSDTKLADVVLSRSPLQQFG